MTVLSVVDLAGMLLRNEVTREAKRQATHLVGSNQEDRAACFIHDDWSTHLEHADLENPFA